MLLPNANIFIINFALFKATVAQLVEQFTRNDQVSGSTPLGGSIILDTIMIYTDFAIYSKSLDIIYVGQTNNLEKRVF